MTRAVRIMEPALNTEELDTETVVPQAVRIIGSARNVEEIPRVAGMIKRVEESIRNKPKNNNYILINEQDLYEKIRQIITKRKGDL